MSAPGLIPLYNQDRLDDATFIANFVARHSELDSLLASLRATAKGDAARHELIVGARGMGKTSLLRRIAIAIGEDPELYRVLLALRFREEQYNVLTLGDFWRNSCDALAGWCEDAKRDDLAKRLDYAIAARDAEKLEATFLDVCNALGRRAVLLLDNLDLILDNLKEEDNWRLRSILQSAHGPIIVGAATQMLAQGGDRGAPFYEFFHPHILEPLKERELLACLRALAAARGERGAPVLALLAKEPQRALTLYALTGGNPRVLALIYQLLERADGHEIMADLEALLDQVTPFYKARVEEYTGANQRAVIDAVALNWDPISSGEIEEKTGIAVTTISPVLTRLKRDGFIEEVQGSGTRANYQLAERFLNIWYLMRHGTRQTRQKLRWLTLLLTRLFSESELERMAGEGRHMAGVWRAEWCEAVREAYAEVALAKEGRIHERLRHERATPQDAEAASSGARMRDVGLTEIEEMSLRADRFYGEGKFEQSIAVFGELIARFGASDAPAIQEWVAWALFNEGVTLGQLGRAEEAITVYDDLIARFGASDATPMQELVARTLFNKGVTIGRLGRAEEEIAVYDDLIARYGTSDAPAMQEQVALALFNKGVRLGELDRAKEEIAVYDDLIARFGASDAPALQEAVARALNRKGCVLVDRFGRFAEAEMAYRQALALASGDVMLRANLAWLLVETGRVDEAAPLIAELSMLAPEGRALLDAGRDIASDNFGAAVAHLGKALDMQIEDGKSPFFEDLLRLLRLTAARGYGDRMLVWFEEGGNKDRYAPVYGAFVARVRGEQYLRDLNPEVRRFAEKFYDFLSRPKEETPPAKKPRRTKRARR